ncbi:MAG: O-antigen ligase family protein [Novosphingobium sp.]
MARLVRSRHPLEDGGSSKGSLWLRPDFQAQFLLVLALLLGGGGAAYGVYNLVVQLASLLILALNSGRVLYFFRRGPGIYVALVILTLALPVMQLLPFPPAVWASLPGRDLLAESLSLIDSPEAWYPISLSPSRTFVALMSLLPVFAIMVLVSNFDDRQWRATFRVLVVAAIALVVLGSLQLLLENRCFLLYRERVHPDFLYATFANHNTSGLFFVLAVVSLQALACLAPHNSKTRGDRPWSSRWVAIAIGAVFAVAVILTQSRSSMALLAVVFAVSAILLMPDVKMVRWQKVVALLMSVAFAIGAMLVVGGGTRFAASLGRFDKVEDVRPAIWEDTLASIERFWPVGSGISSFAEVFEVDESLENVWPYRAGRAHNDYLEIAQEGGLPGLMLILGWIGWSAWASYKSWSNGRLRLASAAITALVMIGLQSVIDYPLRNQAILCVGTLFLAFLTYSSQLKIHRGRGDL